MKFILAYPTAFWRDAGLSGEAYQARGTLRAVVDLCDPSGHPALLALIVGREASRWHLRDPHERRAAALTELAALLGDPASTPTLLLEHDWSRDPWSRGCVAGAPPHTPPTPWRGPHHRLHLAGTEAAAHWPGYLDGAIESADLAAAAILAA